MSTNITSKIEKITPEIAQKWIEKHLVQDKQRRLSMRRVNEYARAMKSGQWLTTHQGIAFDENGELIDGQHRLHAVIESGATIEIMISRNLPVSMDNGTGLRSMDAIDRGWNRSVDQQLHLHGLDFGTAKVTAGACSTILKICAHPQAILTTALALRILEIYKKDVQFCIENMKNHFGIRRASFIGACAFAHHSNPDEIDEFYIQCVEGENIARGAPAYALRQFLMSLPAGRAGSGGNKMIRVANATLQCAYHHVQGSQLQVVRSGNSGVEFFTNKQKANVRKIRQAYGYDE